ncbi:hypothetical protein NDU88_000590 [Pleurodeles waltl]|uniref:Uncharacterized protein n=1 Tax=Pleurodeles waltl TaxID=8319 RepID=A0AAV7TFH7_PLEWA|nr:hypothetical protein NDU88_000590 [Pleurodeles waltl]
MRRHLVVTERRCKLRKNTDAIGRVRANIEIMSIQKTAKIKRIKNEEVKKSHKKKKTYKDPGRGDNPEGEDGGNPEIRVHSETEDGPQRWSESEKDAEAGERRSAHQQRRREDRETAREKNFQTKDKEAQRRAVTTTSLEGCGSSRCHQYAQCYAVPHAIDTFKSAQM